ncbi:transcription factor TGA7-like [Coffea eugenioides]|uniref:transcription factor TGA7-like n=1 Tax=Coffea eugenioides TaxID=49369 RepID=UPI000F608E71|nr:transcription factor TGA7-like [Coffea eugenioides]XP_027149374.1 transcription factor TGA7-like [Coffea eugenioides]
MMNMASSTQFAPSRRMGIYDAVQQMSMWEDTLRAHMTPDTGVSIFTKADPSLSSKSECTSKEPLIPPIESQATRSISDKVLRRLAQNREAARKSRLRKKAYVQQLETSRLKLAQLELEIDRARQQGACIGGAVANVGFTGSINPGIAAFEMEYGHWVDEQQRKTSELRNLLQSPISDLELEMVVDNLLNHYHDLFRMKADAAKADVFYLVSGVWRTSVERFFQWIGGFRPSELVNILMPALEPLTDQQLVDVCNLRHSCQQAEDALSQGIDKLQQNLAQSIAADPMVVGNYGSQMASSIEDFEALETFVNQADHLRQQTLLRMSSLLTTRQAARGLLAFGEYFQRLRALSSLWAARPCDAAA